MKKILLILLLIVGSFLLITSSQPERASSAKETNRTVSQPTLQSGATPEKNYPNDYA